MVARVKLPRLTTGWQNQPQLLERYWDEFANSIETSLNEILEIPLIQEALLEARQQIDSIATDIETVTDLAEQAGENLSAQSKEISLRDSFVSGFTPPIITANATGQVTISNHNREYGDSVLNPTVSVTGDIIDSLEAGDNVLRFFYTDENRVGGDVVYQYTVDPAPPPVQTGNTHVVGTVRIPLVGDRDGNYIRPPGFVQENIE